MAEGGGEACGHAGVMASWDDSGAPLHKVPALPTRGAGSATAVERTRRFLKQLFAGRLRRHRPPLAMR